MLMKKIIVLVFLALQACVLQATQESNLVPEISQDEFNTKIALRESLGMKDIYGAIGVVDLYLENLSDNPVLFPSDFNAEIYVQRDINWEKVDNTYGYPNGDKILPTTKEYPAGLVVPVKPDLNQITTRPLIMRIIVTGILSDSNKEVRAYLDVTIQ